MLPQALAGLGPAPSQERKKDGGNMELMKGRVKEEPTPRASGWVGGSGRG